MRHDFFIRLADEADSRLLWKWRNDPTVRNYSLNSELLPWNEHQQWFLKKLTLVGTKIYILERNDTAIAQIRYERIDPINTEIGDVSVEAVHRGKGYGKKILIETIDQARSVLGFRTLLAYVKIENLFSIRTFTRAGFNFENEVSKKGCLCRRFSYSFPRGVGIEKFSCFK